MSLPWLGLKATVTAIYLFMLAPLLITAAVAFNSGNRSKFPPEGFSLRWWRAAAEPEWIDALLFSLKLGALTAAGAVLLGFPLAYGLGRLRFAGRSALQALTMAPLMLPALVTGMALLQFFFIAGLGNHVGLPALLAAHIAVALPLAVRTMGVTLASMPANLELAAASLGARPIVVKARILLPLVKNGVIAGGVFAFIHAFTDVNLSLFLSRPGQQPITVKILGYLEWGFGPTLAAVAIGTLVVPLLLVVVVERIGGLSDFLYGERRGG